MYMYIVYMYNCTCGRNSFTGHHRVSKFMKSFLIYGTLPYSLARQYICTDDGKLP